MNKDFNSLSLFSGAAILLIGLIIGVVGSGGSQVPMGGLIHNIQESFDAGIAVNGTEFISDSRALSVTTGAFSDNITLENADEATSTISVGSASTSACIRMRTVDDAGWTYLVSATADAILTTTTAAACGY